MTITLTLDDAHTALVHTLVESHYLTMMSTADIFEREARNNHTFDRQSQMIAASFRAEGDSCRMLGQVIEALSPKIDPGNWSWPPRA